MNLNDKYLKYMLNERAVVKTPGVYFFSFRFYAEQ